MCLEGEFEKGVIAKGRFYYSPTQHPKQYGNFFEGTFKEWKFSYGVLTKKDGTRYEGGFLEGKYEGQGNKFTSCTDSHIKEHYTIQKMIHTIESHSLEIFQKVTSKDLVKISPKKQNMKDHTKTMPDTEMEF